MAWRSVYLLPWRSPSSILQAHRGQHVAMRIECRHAHALTPHFASTTGLRRGSTRCGDAPVLVWVAVAEFVAVLVAEAVALLVAVCVDDSDAVPELVDCSSRRAQVEGQQGTVTGR